jgi:DNA-binding CsgD family transcriptional regulator
VAAEPGDPVALLHGPALVVVTGPPGCGRSTALRDIIAAVPGPVHAGGGLAMLSAVPALALSRAVRARLPAHDVHLLAEAVRSRVRGGLLVLDDLQYADPATLAALPLLAGKCRVLVALRTPHRLGEDTERVLRDAASAWVGVPPLGRDAALELARRTVGGRLDDAALAAVADRAGGNPLAVTALARNAAAGRGTPDGDIDQVAYAIATALADLPRAARTALAALGLLGRPAAPGLLGAGATDLQAAGLVTTTADGSLLPVSTYLAETAAGLLDAAARVDLHTRLAELTPPAEAARHLAAAGDHGAAYRRALQAADHASGGARAALLLFACELGTPVDVRVRVAAADAALTAGRPAAAARVLSGAGPLGVEADVLRGEALLQAGDVVAARSAVAAVPDAAPGPVVAARDRVLLLAELAADPAAAQDLAGKITARHPQPTPGVAAALAAVQAVFRTPGWDTALSGAAFSPGDPAVARHSAWLLVENLAADGRLLESAAYARRAADGCVADFAYGWQTRFVAAADWAMALHGGDRPRPATGQADRIPPAAGRTDLPATGRTDGVLPATGGAPGHAGHTADEVLRHAADLTDRALPEDARGYATAATALIEADTGLLGAARAHLDAGPAHPATAWVAQETAWLDGQPDRARTSAGPSASGLLAGLHAITARWAGHDLGVAGTPPIPPGLPTPARRTLTAWATGMGFTAAADGWQPVARREQIRCLLAAGLTDPDPQRAVDALLAAEQLADTAGLTVLAGRARRGLRRHHIHRDTRSPRSGDQLTRRETDVLRLVAAGEPTRRIAGQLGISAETVDTHIRAGMRKLGARTRTEAAALAFAHEFKDGR